MINLTKSYTDIKMKNRFINIIKNYDFNGDIYINKFIKKFLKLYNFKYGLCVNSATNALIICLYALGVKKNDVVMIPAYTCKAVLDALNLLDIKAVFIDNYIDYKKSDFNLDEKDLIKKINKSVKVIILPYMFGKIHKYKKLQKLDIPIIEDITLSFGASINQFKKNKRIIISSFHSSKVVSSVEGGIIATNDKEFYKKTQEISNTIAINKKERVQKSKKIIYNISFSFRPSELNFIWGYLQLCSLSKFIKARQKIAKIYINKLNKNKYILPIYDKNNIYFRFIIGIKKGNVIDILKYLLSKGVEAGRGVYPLLNSYGKNDDLLVNSEKTVLKSISVPLYPGLQNKDINLIIDALNNYEK